MNPHINLPENLRLVPNPLVLRPERSIMSGVEAEEAQRTVGLFCFPLSNARI
jgi:hypothetical protein